MRVPTMGYPVFVRMSDPGDPGAQPLAPGYAPALEPAQHQAPPIWREYYIYSADFTGAQALTAGTLNGAPNVQVFSSLFELMLQIDAPFEIRRTMYSATDPRVYVRLKDTATGRFLHQGTMDMRLAGGQGNASGSATGTQQFMAYDWPTPEILNPATILEISAADFSAGANTVRISFHGNKIRQGYDPKHYREDGSLRVFRDELTFRYPLPSDGNPFSLTSLQRADFIATTDIEADFICEGIVGSFTGTCTVLIDDGGTDRQWMDRAVDIRNLVGNGQVPNYFPSPRYIRRGSPVHAVVTDTSGATNLVRLELIGRKVYDAR